MKYQITKCWPLTGQIEVDYWHDGIVTSVGVTLPVTADGLADWPATHTAIVAAAPWAHLKRAKVLASRPPHAHILEQIDVVHDVPEPAPARPVDINV